jgi:hypothetical protein
MRIRGRISPRQVAWIAVFHLVWGRYDGGEVFRRRQVLSQMPAGLALDVRELFEL